jgi:hypothetical protein
VDFTAQQEKEKYNYQLRIISAKLKKLRELLAIETAAHAEAGGERQKKMEEALARLEDEQKKTGEHISAIMGKINAFEEAAVEVAGEIAPGTLIEICQIALFVTEPLKHVKVRLDRGWGKLVCDPL